MNICILTPRFPFPQYGGDVLRINEIARYLKSQGHRLVLVSLCDEKQPDVEAASTLYDSIHWVRRIPAMSYLHSLTHMCTGRPMQCGYYYSPQYLKLLKQVVEQEKPDLYLSHLLRMVPYLHELGVEDRSIVEMTDALSKTYTLSSSASGVGLLKYIYSFEQRLIEKYENHVVQHFPKVVLVSNADADFLRKRINDRTESLAVHTNGVDVMPSLPSSYDADKICFMGNMRSMQNQDAAIYFVNEVFPLIKQKRPNAKFYIVGSLPPPNVSRLASDDVIVTGFVDDLEAMLSDSCLVVAPVRVAAGIQNKVLVAMGCGVPVVLTSLISNAIPELRDDDNCLIRDDAPSFAEACLHIMDNPSLRSSIAAKGYEVVKANYSWQEKLMGYECF